MEIFILEELEQSLGLSWAFVFKLGDKLLRLKCNNWGGNTFQSSV